MPQEPMPAGVNIAHRGASAYAPEHSGAAILRALEMGAHYIEMDLRQTCDGHLVNLHDATLQRTTDVAVRFPDRAAQSIAHFTLAEVKTLDAGGWFDASGAFAGQKVLTLEEVIVLVGDRAGLWIETKPAPAYPDLEERMAAVLTRHGWSSAPPQRLAVQSFSVESVRKLERFLPDVARVQLVGRPEGVTPAALDAVLPYARGIAPGRHLLSAEVVARAYARGLFVYPYTFQGGDHDALRSDLRTALAWGVDGCITDNPDVLAAILRERPVTA